MVEIVNLDERRPHDVRYVACMECGCDWVAAAPVNAGKLECPSCGALAGEAVKIDDIDWFKRFMRPGLTVEDQQRRTLVCLKAQRLKAGG